MLKTVGFPSTRTGDQTIIDGNLVIGTAGKGIDFSANPSAAGMTSELLDDYEEGTWTPDLTYQTPGTLSVSYSLQYGQYTKIGDLVTCSALVRLSAFTKGTASGQLRISLPFAAGLQANGAIVLYNAPFSSQPVIFTESGGAYVRLQRIQNNGVWVALDDPDANSQYYFTISYQVS